MPTTNPEAPRMLASHSVFRCSVVADGSESFQRLYSLSPVSKHFVRDEVGSHWDLLWRCFKTRSQLKDAILEGGIPFNRVHGTHPFEYPGLDPMFNQVCNKAMFNHTTMVIMKILQSYKGFEQLEQLVDVGGGGDMFSSVPEGDAIFMKWILHDWSDEHCLKLLKNCHGAIPNHGKVIVLEAVLPVMSEISTSVKSTSQLDVLMMTQTPGGKERTREEFLTLVTEPGFKGIRYGCFVRNFWVWSF
ncbi:Caffeic acid 3-O-methyltransferase [Morella rubra]|uniref:Caffeic acid 3-O-methyltransferase n=1 Tax=Morella rubra TaxID=262757 RepID=A0A6A1URU2_9ROSI|nr:Caffeic acid 3-O-methyltransferase [Morella rubra]